MIKFREARLENGLQLIFHHDASSPMVAFNLLYKVGSRDEDFQRTGFAHLFEHLMFGGSANIPSFDRPLQEVGGDNNAFTSSDLTNYYITLPKESLETAFWLESDRMLKLAFTEKSLSVQKQVVVEEFKQRYLNQPYGDVMLLLRPLAYLKHPYQWPTIGKNMEHIEQAGMQEVKDFFYRFYRPNNAILSLAGNLDFEEVLKLTKKWFGDIPSAENIQRNYPLEENQVQERKLTVERDVPLDAIYKAYHMVDRLHPDYYATDLISDLLAQGNSSRLFRTLVKEKEIFNDISAYISGDIDPGLFLISAKLNPSVSMEKAETALQAEIDRFCAELISEEELNKVKNKIEAAHAFGQTSVLNKAMGLAISAFIDQPDLINKEPGAYRKVSSEDIQQLAGKLFRKNNCSTLYYKAKNKK